MCSVCSSGDRCTASSGTLAAFDPLATSQRELRKRDDVPNYKRLSARCLGCPRTQHFGVDLRCWFDVGILFWGAQHCKGKVSAKDVEEIIGGATAQGASQLPSMSAPAHPQNFQRSLKAALGYPGGAPRFTWARIPTASGDRFHPLLCPHDWFRSLFRERPRGWESSVRGDVGAAERYWDELQESDVLRDHPELLTEDKRWFIPCGLHGDAGQFSHNDSLMVISFNSLIGSGVTHWTACSA